MKAETKPGPFAKEEIEARIDDLLGQMTLLEKLGQMTQLGPKPADEANADDPDPALYLGERNDYHEDWIRKGAVGSFLGVQGAAIINRLQKIAVEESRLGIPLIFGLDVIHGYRTIFPIPLAEACSWEPELARRTAEAAARESAAGGLHWTFAPMVDIARDARWGRITEGAGEDPYLGSAFAAARTAGFQGDDLADPEHVAACVKHFIGYGAALAGRDYNTVEMAVQTLYETYLPPFKAALEAGAATLMSSFNDLNGVPASANRFTLTTLLRDQLGFDGFVISDYSSIQELIPHGLAADRADAGRLALMAGVDMDMMTRIYCTDMVALVEQGVIPLAVVDEAVRRVLRVKFRLGLFENPYRGGPEKEAAVHLNPGHIELAREAGRRSIVLLKNEGGVLPLAADGKRIAVIGPLADSQQDLLGSWAFTGDPATVVSVLAGIRTTAHGPVSYARGCDVDGADRSGFAAALELARAADVVVAVVGETAEMGGEAASRQTLGLPGVQEELVKALKALGKPLVVTLINGRPLAIPEVVTAADAVVEAWQLGAQAGHAIADVLYGKYNPSGRLVTTFPYGVGQCPVYYNHTRTGRPATEMKFTSRYIDGPTEPLFPFGFGLSYTRFDYSDLEVSPQSISQTGKLRLAARVTNCGERDGEEVVQLYVCDRVASRVRPVKELKGFRKIKLAPGESQVVGFELDAQQLGFYDPEMRYVVEPGTFSVWIGPDSSRGMEGSFTITGERLAS